MRLSIPGFDGLYFDTNAQSPAVNLVCTAAGRYAPKPQGYALQLLPSLWSFEVDLRELPNDHPIQYLHPEGAHSLERVSADRSIRQAGSDLESVLQFVWAVNWTVESAANQLVGRAPDHDGVVIEIDNGTVTAGGEPLGTDEFDIEDDAIDDGSADGMNSTDEDDPSETQ